MSLDLTVSIVIYREDPDRLNQVIASVLRSDLDLRLYLVDNSPDPTIRKFIPADPRIIYTHLPHNPGFGVAHNHAIRLAAQSAPYHLVLNPDVVFDPAILRGLATVMASQPGVGLLAPKVFYPNGQLQRLCKLLPAPADVILRRFFPGSKLVKRRNKRYEMVGIAYDRACSVPAVSGCFMFFRSQALWAAGLFDEEFFMYFEDVDISRRIAACSEVHYSPSFSITHCYHKGSYLSFNLFIKHISSAIYYFNKWGWIFDASRRRINEAALTQFDHLNS